MAASESNDGLRKARTLEKEKKFAEAAIIYESFLDRPDIAMKLGDWYRSGKVKGIPDACQIPKDEKKAIECYNKALKIPDAYTKIGSIYLNNKSDIYNENQGVMYCKWGISNGSVSAYACLSDYYYRRYEYDSAFQNAIKGAKAGDIESIALLGLLFSTENCTREETGFDTDYRMAARCFDTYLDLDGDNRKALDRYAWLLLKKRIDIKEFPSSLNALLISAKLENSVSIDNVAEAYRTGRYGAEPDVDLAAGIIEHYHKKRPMNGIIAFRYVIYSLLGLYEPLDYFNILSIFNNCSKVNDEFRLLIGFILYHGINCQIDLMESKKMFMSVNPKNPIASLYLNLIDMGNDPSKGTYLQKTKDSESNRLVQMLSTYNLATWIMAHPQSKNSYDTAWTLLKSINIDMPFVNLLPIISSMAFCKKIVKNIDNDHPWVVIPLKKSIRIRDPEAQEIYADYIRTTDPNIAIQYYKRSARCGNIHSKDKLDMLQSQSNVQTDKEFSQIKIDYLTERIRKSTDIEYYRLVSLKKYLESDIEAILERKIRSS